MIQFNKFATLSALAACAAFSITTMVEGSKAHACGAVSDDSAIAWKVDSLFQLNAIALGNQANQRRGVFDESVSERSARRMMARLPLEASDVKVEWFQVKKNRATALVSFRDGRRAGVRRVELKAHGDSPYSRSWTVRRVSSVDRSTARWLGRKMRGFRHANTPPFILQQRRARARLLLGSRAISKR